MNSFRFIERGIRAEIARQEKILAGRRPGRPGDAALRPRLAARSPRCAPRRRRTTTATSPSPTCCPWRSTSEMIEAAARRHVRAARRPRRALRARARPERRQRAAARVPRASSATTSRRRSPRDAEPAPPPQTLANWVTGELAGAPGGRRGPGGLARARRARSRRSSGWSAAKRVSVGAGRQVLDRLVAEGGDPRRSSRPRASPRSTAATSSPRSSPRRSPANADAAERVRDGNAKAIGPIVGHVMRETKGRADGDRGRAARQRAARHLSARTASALDGAAALSGRRHSETAARHILDCGPKATGARCANMLAMNRSAANSSVSSPRRFILLPEESVDGPRPRTAYPPLPADQRRAGRGRAACSAASISRRHGSPASSARLGRA